MVTSAHISYFMHRKGRHYFEIRGMRKDKEIKEMILKRKYSSQVANTM